MSPSYRNALRSNPPSNTHRKTHRVSIRNHQRVTFILDGHFRISSKNEWADRSAQEDPEMAEVTESLATVTIGMFLSDREVDLIC